MAIASDEKSELNLLKNQANPSITTQETCSQTTIASKESDKSSGVYRCTACDKKIRSTYNANLHPLLGALVCRECYTNYGDGDFSKLEDGVDENGYDNFCRWCTDGGDLHGCLKQDENGSICKYCFCKDCIVRNFPDDPVLVQHPDSGYEWHCYVCVPSSLDSIRQRASNIMKELASLEFSHSKLATETEEPVSVEPVPEKPVPEKLVPEEPVISEESVSEEPVSGKLVTGQPAVEGPMTEEPAAEEPVIEEPVVVEPVTEEPVVVKPVTEEPVVVEPVIEEPVVVDPVTEEPVVVEPVTEEPMADEPMLEEPILEEPMIEESVLEEQTCKELEPEKASPSNAVPHSPDIEMQVEPCEVKSSEVSSHRDRPFRLGKTELAQRLAYFTGVKQQCIEEINAKMDNIFELIQTKQIDDKRNLLISKEIDSLRRPLTDLDDMLDNLEELNKSCHTAALG